jgi:hypothetical protein
MSGDAEKLTVGFWIVVVLMVVALPGVAALALFFFWPVPTGPFTYELK